MTAGPSVFDRIGAEQLRAVITDFYDRVFGDVMIGFMFEGTDKAHLIAREVEFAANFLGAPGASYTGRPIRAAHAKHRIFGGHFERRLHLLKQAMAAHAVDPEVQRVWIDHTNALRSQVTRDRGSECGETVEGTPEPTSQAADALIKLGRK